MRIARRIVISGVVQGVGFRWATRDEAVRRRLSGWVSNQADGTVEAWIEGDEEAVADMLAWTESGPLGSVVSGVEVREVAPAGAEGFEIRA